MIISACVNGAPGRIRTYIKRFRKPVPIPWTTRALVACTGAAPVTSPTSRERSTAELACYPVVNGVRGGIRTHTVQFLGLTSPAVGLHALKFGGA